MQIDWRNTDRLNTREETHVRTLTFIQKIKRIVFKFFFFKKLDFGGIVRRRVLRAESKCYSLDSVPPLLLRTLSAAVVVDDFVVILLVVAADVDPAATVAVGSIAAVAVTTVVVVTPDQRPVALDLCRYGRTKFVLRRLK